MLDTAASVYSRVMGISKYKDSTQGAVYHLYNRGNRKQPIFEREADNRLYLGLLKRYCRETDFSVIAYCLMPNHIHLLVRQNGSVGPNKLMSRLHTSYAMYFNKEYRKVGHLFQDRYKQKIVSDNDFLIRLISYFHLNPVKDKISLTPEAYQWSSYGWYQQPNRKKRWGICDLEAVSQLGLETIAKLDPKHLASQINSNDVFDSA